MVAALKHYIDQDTTASDTWGSQCHSIHTLPLNVEHSQIYASGTSPSKKLSVVLLEVMVKCDPALVDMQLSVSLLNQFSP